jgi:uncharacterized membrane protein HdeD (DUF308 family)
MNENVPSEIREDIHQSAGWLIFLSILLILLGVIAMLAPIVTTLTITLVLGWVLIVSGIVRVVKAFRSKPVRGFWLNLLVGILYIIAGIMLLSGPLQGALALTWVLGVLFLAEGIYEIIMSFQVQPGGGLSWLVLLDGIITLILGIFILGRWPFDALWLIGFYVGLSIICSGAALFAIAFNARKSTA